MSGPRAAGLGGAIANPASTREHRAVVPAPMIDCLSENQVAELLSGPLVDDQTINAHLDQCAACVAIVAAALEARPRRQHAVHPA